MVVDITEKVVKIYPLCRVVSEEKYPRRMLPPISADPETRKCSMSIVMSTPNE